jgi:hypothetical protein
VGEGVLEGVLVLQEEARFIEELGRLEMREATMQRRLGPLGDGLQQGQRHVGADDGGGLEQALLLGEQAIDARGEHRLHCHRHVQAVEGHDQTISPAFAHQYPRLDQRLHAFLQKEGIAFGARDQQGREGREAGVVAEQGLQQFVGARRRQRVEPQLRVIGLAAPAVLILRPVIHQEQQLGGGQVLDQAIEQGLGLRVDPMQVLEDQEQGLHLAFA